MAKGKKEAQGQDIDYTAQSILQYFDDKPHNLNIHNTQIDPPGRILDYCTHQLDPQNSTFKDEREENEKADVAGERVMECVRRQVLWKIEQDSSFEIKCNGISILAELADAVRKIKATGDWGFVLGNGLLPKGICLAITWIGQRMKNEEIQHILKDSNLLRRLVTIRETESAYMMKRKVHENGVTREKYLPSTPWDYLDLFFDILASCSDLPGEEKEMKDGYECEGFVKEE